MNARPNNRLFTELELKKKISFSGSITLFGGNLKPSTNGELTCKPSMSIFTSCVTQESIKTMKREGEKNFFGANLQVLGKLR